ncbi:acyl-CoA dehydrogenase family protein [Streptomyces sp. PSKA54]|uniref:Acyl-CoA dehydrogenase family protein n=1 Tax=Streptomyces himalayensis subsp. aureolus TaxID=2758039 RepID=A0A7W2HKJ6_9ACTN|nr:acyl-CoA dehydrogenase family protein [Streptomyces himalayensis]MBA4867256.1 acyl-CoA dehydrogenase family protein [Streptomyces himalayensis subsp. aureolus]
MALTRILPSREDEDLLNTIMRFAAAELQPRVAEAEENGTFPRDVFRKLGALGVLSLPHDAEYDGGELPAEVALQVVEELSRTWASIGVGVTVHWASVHPLWKWGSDEQRKRWLPELISGDLLGGFCLSEPEAGSDPGAMKTTATREGNEYVINGVKAWITHGGEADFYSVMARTSGDGAKGISCFLVPADTPGISAAPPERKMGLNGSRTSEVRFENVRVSANRRIGDEGRGLAIALDALDTGRLCIAAVSTGVAQAALDHAADYARTRQQFGRPIIDFQGVSFLLADMSARTSAARALYLDAARRKDRGVPFTRLAAEAKLVASDTAMAVTTDAVQVYGGAGYTRDYPVERLMREAKIMQIFEGTNQIQRHVIGRDYR